MKGFGVEETGEGPLTHPTLAGPSSTSEPTLSEAELLYVLENDGWHDVECDLFLRHGKTLADLEDDLIQTLREAP